MSHVSSGLSAAAAVQRTHPSFPVAGQPLTFSQALAASAEQWLT